MKKAFLLSSIALAFLGLSSCQQELLEKENPVVSEFTVNRTLTLPDMENQPASATKSAYEPGYGIRMSGQETMALFYGNPADGQMNRAVAQAQGNRKYQITHAAIAGTEAYNYWFMLPDSRSIAYTGPNTTSLTLPAVQFPSETTYDPSCDFIVGKAMENVSPAENSLTADQLKRLTWPFILEVVLPENEQLIRTATLTFDGQDNAPVGTYEVNHSTAYDQTGITTTRVAGNTVSVLYPEGLKKTGNTYPIYLMLKPGQLDGVLKLSVTTDKTSYSGEVALPAGFAIKEMFNKKRTPVELSVKTAADTRFAGFTATDLNLEHYRAADGNTNWLFSNCQVYEGLDGKNGIQLNAGGSITLPQYYGSVIKNIRVYFHPENTEGDSGHLGYKDFVNTKEPNFDKDYVGAFSTYEIKGLDNAIISAISYELEPFTYWARFMDTSLKNGETEVTCNKAPLATPWHMGLGKGRLSVTLKDFNFADGKKLQFGFNPKGNTPDGNPDNSACRLDLNKDAATPLKFSMGGGFTWAEKILQFPAEPMEKFTFVCKDDQKHPGKYVMSLEVNDQELCAMDQRTDNSSTLKEKRIYFQMGFRGAAQPGQSFTVTSFNYEPFERVVL